MTVTSSHVPDLHFSDAANPQQQRQKEAKAWLSQQFILQGVDQDSEARKAFLRPDECYLSLNPRVR